MKKTDPRHLQGIDPVLSPRWSKPVTGQHIQHWRGHAGNRRAGGRESWICGRAACFPRPSCGYWSGSCSD